MGRQMQAATAEKQVPLDCGDQPHSQTHAFAPITIANVAIFLRRREAFPKDQRYAQSGYQAGTWPT